VPMKISQRIQQLPAYAFAAVDEAVDALKAQNVDVIDFGVGDHTLPSPAIARERLKTAVDEHATTGYPSYVGSPGFRAAACDWMQRRFGVTVHPATEICSTIGSKEGVCHLPMAFTDPGDVVIVPTPGYPPYGRGTGFAGAEPYFVPLTAANNWLIDFDAIPADIAARATLLWMCYPNSPTGAVADRAFFERAVAFCREHDILLVNDEAYTEIYFTPEPPISLLQVAREGMLVVHSMSKRSMMTGWRIGWIAGDATAVAAFKKLKTNIDSGTPSFIQDGAIVALNDESHVTEMREQTARKRQILADALVAAGLPDCRPDSTLYHWQRVPDGMSGEDFAKRLLVPEVGIVCTPGEWLTQPAHDGTNPGAGYVRFSLVPPVERCEEAAKRLTRVSLT
jgi:LL-diaminopimelate aminotransferase